MAWLCHVALQTSMCLHPSPAQLSPAGCPRSVPPLLQRQVQLSQAAGRTGCSCRPAHELDGGGLGGMGAARGDGRADQLAVHPAGLRDGAEGPHRGHTSPVTHQLEKKSACLWLHVREVRRPRRARRTWASKRTKVALAAQRSAAPHL